MQMTIADPAALAELARTSNAWPFEEAKKLVERLKKRPKDGPVLFETGYGPSGLPHIGTFGEVARTTMVRNAFRALTEDKVPTRLLCFSDDMDGLRKVPDNVPNQELLRANLGKPLTEVPDPFGSPEGSFGAANNARLRAFLDQFGFDYEFASSTEYYRSGRFDETLLLMLDRFERVMEIMLPSLREERSATYSPFLPIHPKTRVVMQVPIEERNVSAGTIVWRDPETGERFESPVTGGHVKLQWKPDWAMRWTALEVDYEMSGKDLIDSVKLANQICRALDETPPEGFNYELFLDEKGQKISKSKGNGLTIDEWLTYASPESLSLYMFQKPREAKKLHFDVIPRAVDEYFQFLGGFPRQEPKQQLGNPVWHIHGGRPPVIDMPVTFALLLNLVSASNAENRSVLWGFIGRYAPGVSPETHPKLDELVGYALRYYEDHVKPTKRFSAPDEVEREALERLADALGQLDADPTPEQVQEALYDVGRAVPRYQDFKAKGATPERPGVSQEWFSALYRILIGQEKGPRFGSFAALYGVEETRELIRRALDGELARSATPAEEPVT